MLLIVVKSSSARASRRSSNSSYALVRSHGVMAAHRAWRKTNARASSTANKRNRLYININKQTSASACVKEAYGGGSNESQ